MMKNTFVKICESIHNVFSTNSYDFESGMI